MPKKQIMAFSTKRDGVKITIELNESLSMEFEGGACYRDLY